MTSPQGNTEEIEMDELQATDIDMAKPGRSVDDDIYTDEERSTSSNNNSVITNRSNNKFHYKLRSILTRSIFKTKRRFSQESTIDIADLEAAEQELSQAETKELNYICIATIVFWFVVVIVGIALALFFLKK